jgi:DNA-directed RNA polymerase specialized sigma24 family protein
MVLGVCRRWLRDPNDLDDALQATFLVLARIAGCLRGRGGLGPWLHGVARRVASRMRAEAGRRAAGLGDPERVEAAPGPGGRDGLCAALDEEVERLPEAFRLPIVR